MGAKVLGLPDQSANVATAIVKGKNGKQITLSVRKGDGTSTIFDFAIDSKQAQIDVQGHLQNAAPGTIFHVELDAKSSGLIQILPDMQ